MKRLLSVLILIIVIVVTVPVTTDHGSALPTGTPTTSPSPTITETATPKVPTVPPTSTMTISPTMFIVPPKTSSNSTETALPLVVPLVVYEPTPESYGPDNFPFYINPLTGMLVDDPAILNRRPMVIKVTNFPRYVRPQSGLSRADIVYEYYMEDGIPRFIGVFYGQDAEKVGPVRSGRLFDEHIFRMYDAIFVFGNADRRVMDYFLELEDHFIYSYVVENFNDSNHKCGVDEPNRLCRDPEIKGYNSMFANTAALESYIDRNYGNYRPNLTGMYFSDLTPLSTIPGIDIRVRYSLKMYHRWEFSSVLGQYLRFQETRGYPDPEMETYEPLEDALTEKQITADNVVVLVVEHDYYTKTDGSEINNIFLQGRGQAIVFRDGFVYEAEWVRPKDGGVLRLYTPEGEPFPLKPGQTWFQVISQYSEISNIGMKWSFTFVLPPVPEAWVLLEGDEPLNWFFRDQNPYLPFP